MKGQKQFNIANESALIEAANIRGFHIRTMTEFDHPEWGKMVSVMMDNASHRIHFHTAVLSGRNYFKIHSVHNTYHQRTYLSPRFHMKHIPIVGDICGDAHITMQGVTK